MSCKALLDDSHLLKSDQCSHNSPLLAFSPSVFVGVYLNRNCFCCSVATQGVKHLGHIWLHRDTLNIFIMRSDLSGIWHCNIHSLNELLYSQIVVCVWFLRHLCCYIVSWFFLGSPLNVMPHSVRVIVTLDCYNVYLKPVLLEHYCIVLQFLHVGIPRARETVADQWTAPRSASEPNDMLLLYNWLGLCVSPLPTTHINMAVPFDPMQSRHYCQDNISVSYLTARAEWGVVSVMTIFSLFGHFCTPLM